MENLIGKIEIITSFGRQRFVSIKPIPFRCRINKKTHKWRNSKKSLRKKKKNIWTPSSPQNVSPTAEIRCLSFPSVVPECKPTFFILTTLSNILSILSTWSPVSKKPSLRPEKRQSRLQSFRENLSTRSFEMACTADGWLRAQVHGPFPTECKTAKLSFDTVAPKSTAISPSLRDSIKSRTKGFSVFNTEKRWWKLGGP